MRHAAAVRVQDQGKHKIPSLLVIPRSVLPEPVEAIFPHLLNETHVDVAVGVWGVGEVNERSHVLHIPIAWDFNEGGRGGCGGRDGGGVHPGCGGFGEVGRMDWGVEGSEIGYGVVGAEGGVCFGKMLAMRR